MTPNEKAFLDMLAYSEGTDNGRQATNDHGYDVMVGGGLFHSYADHPRTLVHISRQLVSSAAGRYQLLARYFDGYKKQLGLTDFSPASQDAVALQQIRECHAINDIAEGNFVQAVSKCSHIWASLPGNNYGQRQNDIADLQSIYTKAGGVVS